MHLKRQKTPKSWPTERKGTAYIIRGRNLKNGIPLLILLRDILKITKDRRETKIALNSGKILLNNKKISDEKNSVRLFDVITLVPSNEHYRVTLKENGKFSVEKEDEKNAIYKVAKIINKKILKGKKTQINLSDGKNFLFEGKCKINDSILINLKENKIEKCLELKEKSNAFIIGGKHSGIKGTITKIDLDKRMVELKNKEKDINVLIKQLIILE
jgi:small subunit ribosomal protein S4e